MRFATTRIQKALFSMLAMLSMSVSSIASCACSHHGPKLVDETKSCHSAESTSPQHPHEDAGDVDSRYSSVKEICSCVRTSVDSPVKAEAFKFKKAPVISSTYLDLEPPLFSSTSPRSIFETLFSVTSKRFEGARSNRGPPVL